jgi:hypothetical protein
MDTYFTLLDRGDMAAFHIRHRAHHEVGHLWAIKTLGLPLPWASLTDFTPMPRQAPGLLDRLSALALTLHATSIQVDILTDLDRPDLDDVDVYSCWEHAHELVDEVCCCPRGGDQRGWHLIETPQKMEPLVDQILVNWRGVDALARMLAFGLHVKPAVIQRCLDLPGPRLRPSR